MNQRLVESIAQIISAMSDEERQLLGKKVQLPDDSQMSLEEATSFRVAELAQDIQAFEKKYSSAPNAGYISPKSGLIAEPVTSELQAKFEDEPLHNSFLQVAQSLQLEGPEDLSINVDHYLYGLPKQDA